MTGCTHYTFSHTNTSQFVKLQKAATLCLMVMQPSNLTSLHLSLRKLYDWVYTLYLQSYKHLLVCKTLEGCYSVSNGHVPSNLVASLQLSPNFLLLMYLSHFAAITLEIVLFYCDILTISLYPNDLYQHILIALKRRAKTLAQPEAAFQDLVQEVTLCGECQKLFSGVDSGFSTRGLEFVGLFC